MPDGSPRQQEMWMESLERLHPGISHDLRSPLHIFNLLLTLLRRSVEGSEGESERERRLEWIDSLEAEVRRLRRGVNSVLAQIAPAEDAREYDLNGVAAEVEVLVGPQCRQQQVSLEVTGWREPLPVEGHADQLRRAVTMLAVHALRGAGEDAALRVRCRRENSDALLIVDLEGAAPGAADHLLEAADLLLRQERGTLDLQRRENGSRWEARLPGGGGAGAAEVRG